MLSPRDALDAFFSAVSLAPPRDELVPIELAFRRVLAFDAAARADVPAAARSAMDGFALAAGSAPGQFTIVGEVRMGEIPQRTVSASEALRIPTGGTLPCGADAVVPVEDARTDGEMLHVGVRVGAGDNVIPAGADVRRGEVVVRAGTRVGSAQAGALAALGLAKVSVYRRPLVGVLSSGDELVLAGTSALPGTVFDSNRYAVAASLEAMGAHPRHYPIVGDESGACERALTEALRDCDAVAITGGSSVGERDRLSDAVASLGEPGVVAHGLRVKPGKPALFGALGSKPILGLPGNPTSALLVLEAVMAPIVAALVGAPAPRASIDVHLAQPLRGREGWTWYVPVTLRHEAEGLAAHPLALHSFSATLTARAGGYVVKEEAVRELPAGSPVTVYAFMGGSF